jgi:hypothetical protein
MTRTAWNFCDYLRTPLCQFCLDKTDHIVVEHALADNAYRHVGSRYHCCHNECHHDAAGFFVLFRRQGLFLLEMKQSDAAGCSQCNEDGVDEEESTEEV